MRLVAKRVGLSARTSALVDRSRTLGGWRSPSVMNWNPHLTKQHEPARLWNTSDEGEGVNKLSTVQDRLDRLQEELGQIREEAQREAEAQAASQSSPFGGIEASAEVTAQAEALARQVAQQLGVDLPLQAAPGSSLPIIQLPEEFQKYGGVGVAVVVAPPTDAARSATRAAVAVPDIDLDYEEEYDEYDADIPF